MGTHLLTDSVWQRLQELSKRHGRAYVAVPFIGQGAARRLALRRGDILVTRFDEPTIRAGQVHPKEILTFLRRGVDVHAVSNLHAKVFVFGRTAVVGSTNASKASVDELIEAGLETSEHDAVRACRRFIESLRGEVVEPEFAKSLLPLYPAERGRSRGPGRRPPTASPRQSPLWAVRVYSGSWDEEDYAAQNAAQQKARSRLRDSKLFRLDDFRLPHDVLARSLKVGDRLLRIHTYATRCVRVTPPARVLEIHPYKSRRGAARCMIVIEVRKRVREKDLATVVGRVGRRAEMLKSIAYYKPIRDTMLVYSLGQLWPKASDNR